MSSVSIGYGNQTSEKQLKNLFFEEKSELCPRSYEPYRSNENIFKNKPQGNSHLEMVHCILNEILMKITSIKEPQNILKGRNTFKTQTRLTEKKKTVFAKQKKAIKFTLHSGKYNRKTFIKETSRREKSFSNKYRIRKKKFKNIVKAVKENEQVDEYKYIKKGKRGLVGGKAKGKPPEGAKCEKHDSDEDSDKFYFYRVSLGYFLQCQDDSGASTSNQSESYYPRLLSPLTSDELQNKNSDELELLELQKWGSSSFCYEYEI